MDIFEQSKELTSLIEDPNKINLIYYPYEKYGECVIAFEMKDKSKFGMNVEIADISKSFSMNRRVNYDRNLPIVNNLGKEIVKRFNEYNDLKKISDEYKKMAIYLATEQICIPVLGIDSIGSDSITDENVLNRIRKEIEKENL